VCGLFLFKLDSLQGPLKKEQGKHCYQRGFRYRFTENLKLLEDKVNDRRRLKLRSWQMAAMALLLIVSAAAHAAGCRASPSLSFVASGDDKPYVVEWVYKVKWGHADEFWQIFKKYQIAILNREKELGYVTSYAVYRPGLHTGEDIRWEYSVVITYKNQAASGHGEEITKQLFHDQETLKREENRRWELTEAHYDLPIRQIDPNGDGTE
jgi:hypothetical protein